MKENHFKETLKLSIPLVVGQLGHMLMGVVDSMMVGQLGAAELAAVAIGHGLFMIVLVFGFGLSLGLVPVVSEYFGAGEKEKCGFALRQGFVLYTSVSVVMTLAAYYGAELISFLGQEAEVESYAIRYAETLAWSTYPMVIFSAYKSFTEALNITKPALIITLVANLLNVFVNWLLIFGNWGFPELEIVGAGWATFSSRVFMALLMIAYVLRAKHLKEYDPSFHFRKLDFQLMKRLFKIGTASGMQYVFEGGAFVAASFIIGTIGKNDLAAHQIAINLASLTFMFAMGVSMASAIRVGNASGRKSVEDMKLAGLAAFKLIILIMFVNAVVFILFRNALPYFYIDDLVVIKIASELLIIAAFFQISDGIQAVGIGVLRGLSDVLVPTRITFIAYWIVSLPLAYFLAFQYQLGVHGVWIGLSIGLSLSALLLYSRFLKLTRT